MRAVIQRVTEASVTVDEKVVGRIECGLVALIGVEEGDSDKDAKYLADKTSGLRIFEDAEGLMNVDLTAAGGAVLAISQFTLLGDVRKGKRPSFISAAKPEDADRLYQTFCVQLKENGIRVEQGIFRADMQVALVNDGPVTILLDSKKLF